MLLLDAAATRQRLPLPELVAALRRMFVAGCVVPPRHVHALTDAQGAGIGSLLLMPAWRPGAALGIKTVNVFPGNAALGLPALHAVYNLFDAQTGQPLAQLDGTELTTRRTVAASALAASYLARRGAERLLIVGAGRLAAQIAQALACTCPGLAPAHPGCQVQVWARRREAAEGLARQLAEAGWQARAARDLEVAVRWAHVVSCATLAAQPLIRGAWLQPGTHLDLMGAFTPEMRECDSEAVARARVHVDTEEALAKAGELVQAAQQGRFGPQALCATLAELCRGQPAAPGRDAGGRRSEAEITLFKSVGTALEDLAAAELACKLST